MNPSRICRHNTERVNCLRCRWYRRYPELDRPSDSYQVRSTPWGSMISLHEGPEPLSGGSMATAPNVDRQAQPARNNDPQFDDEHQETSTSSQSSSHSSLLASNGLQARRSAPQNIARSPSSSRTAPPPNYSEATTNMSNEERTQYLQAEARNLSQRSTALMARGQEFCDLARVTPRPRAFAYPSSPILRRDHETRVGDYQELTELWRSHLYDMAVWRESLDRWVVRLAELQTDDHYDHDLATTRERLQRDAREMAALIRQAGLDVPGHLVP